MPEPTIIARQHSKSATAKMLNVSTKTLERKVKDHEIGCVRVGRRVYFTDQHIQAFIDAHTVDARAAV